MTPHINAKEEDIAKIVLAPGDPLRAKYIAENFLENYRLVNTVRNILAYTGTYKGKEITVFSTGMGMPSMGIYCYELYKFYNVETIIRIGSCGAYSADGVPRWFLSLLQRADTSGTHCYRFTSSTRRSVRAYCRKRSLIMEKIYVALIVKDLKTFDQVPGRIKEQVKQVLIDLDCADLAE